MTPETLFAEMQSYTARLESFLVAHQLNKRRASSQSKKKKANTVEWPHQKPEPEQLARAGFFYRPATNSDDNAQCFFCNVKLDGWEENDDPVLEHLAHSDDCAYATSISVSSQHNPSQEVEDRDPMSEALSTARHATFTFADGWPHEHKKGWKCKINKMVDAGWSWDPNPQADDGNDGVTCFYCNLSLDGWEPKDDPLEEHKRRTPECRFFELLEHFHGGKPKKTKTRSKASSRSSAISKASRMSTQSAASEAISMAASELDFDITDEAPVVEEGIVGATSHVTSTNASKKKKSKQKGNIKVAKGAKSKKQASQEEDEDEVEVEGNELDLQESTHRVSVLHEDDEIVANASRASRAKQKGNRASKQTDSSVVELSQANSVAPRETALGRGLLENGLQKEEPHMPETPDAGAIAKKRLSEVSAQLQDELEVSISQVNDESTPHVEILDVKRGVKRTSDGVRKASNVASSTVQVVIPVATKAQSKRRRKPKQESNASSRAAAVSMPIDSNDTAIELANPSEGKTQPSKRGKGKPSGKKGSSERSARSSKATVTSEEPDLSENLSRDEIEIELELNRIASEMVAGRGISDEQDRGNEYESSPSHGRTSLRSKAIEVLEDKIEAETEQSAPLRNTFGQSNPTPSPCGSDKENQPSSTVQQSTKQRQPKALPSPTKTNYVPLAPGTPILSTAKISNSPSKQISHLTSTVPWKAIDLDNILLASPQPTPGRLGQQLTAAAGVLTSPERVMTVEAWIKYRAEQSESDLKTKCEEMVALFEKEGMRALQTLQGINTLA